MKSNKNSYPLHEAIENNNLVLFQELLNKGENPNTYDQYGDTPLILLINKPSHEVTKYPYLKSLLETKNFDPNVTGNNNEERNLPLPFSMAVGSKQWTIVNDILNCSKFDCRKIDHSTGKTPIQSLIVAFHQTKGKMDTNPIKIILKKDASLLDQKDNFGKTAREYIMELNNETLNKLLDPFLNKKTINLNLHKKDF